MSVIGERIKSRRLELGLGQTELAQRLGESKQTVFKYESGIVENIPLSKVRALSDILGCSPAYLAGWEDEKRGELSELCSALDRDDMDRLLQYARTLSHRSYEGENDVVYIRHYLTAAAAGYAAPIEGEDYELIERTGDVPDNAHFAIDIDGDSMEPYIKNGQRVYVRRGEDLREFDVGIFFVDGDVYCKQWCRDYAGVLHLLSANPRRADANISIAPGSGRNCICFGKVLLPMKLPRPEYY